MNVIRCFLLLLLLPQSGLAQPSAEAVEKADALISEFYERNNIPGMSVSVFQADELIFSKGYGYANLEEGTKVDPAKTKFRIGSVSKTLTSAALGRLMAQKIVDPDDVIHTHVPTFPKKEYPITVRQVAGHLAGIRHYRGLEFMSTKSYTTVEEGLTIFANDPLLFKPGTRYSYSSYGWNLISAVIEHASGTDFLNYMRQTVFEPLGMNQTEPEWSRTNIEHLTTFYIPLEDGNQVAPFVDNSYKWAGGGFVGTTEDLIRFGKAFFDDTFLPEQIQETLMTPLELESGESTEYGMGWRTLQNDGKIWLGHSGGSVGGSTMFLLNKEDRIIIAYAINRSNVGFNSLHWKLAGIFLE
jgi:CubicO group peptidase (beta-lactamase class C family)